MTLRPNLSHMGFEGHKQYLNYRNVHKHVQTYVHMHIVYVFIYIYEHANIYIYTHIQKVQPQLSDNIRT